MSQKSKYLAVFGLEENASKKDIRKAYRKLAMQFHPDRNADPKAHQLFIQLTEAYTFLLEDKPEKQVDTKQKNKTEKTFEQRKKEAEFRYRQQVEKEKREQDRYFRNITSGLKWKTFSLIAYVGLVVGLILLLEPFLPSIFEKHEIIARSESYNGILKDQVVCLKTNREIKLFVKNPYNSMFHAYPEITLERSLIFRNPVKIWLQTFHYRKSFEVDFSAINLYPMIPILFSIPFFVTIFKRKSHWFTFGLLASQILVFPCLFWFLLTQDRWFYLITLGFV